MTDDELDLLASAYVDGEATPEEVALVEADPELLARVEVFRAIEVDEPSAAPEGLAQRHLAVAMAEFEALAQAGATDGASVVDLRDRAARRSEAAATAEPVRRQRRSPLPALPSWLPAAAVFVVISGGLIWAIGQGSDSDDDSADETAAVAVDTEADAGSDEASDVDQSLRAAGEADAAATESAEASEAMEEAMDDAADDAESAAAPAEGGADEEATEESEDAEAEFVELAPQLVLDEIPDAETLATLELPEPETRLELSRCGFEVVAPSLGPPIGFVPSEVRGQRAELFLFEDGDGTEIRLLVGDDCQVIEPGP